MDGVWYARRTKGNASFASAQGKEAECAEGAHRVFMLWDRLPNVRKRVRPSRKRGSRTAALQKGRMPDLF